MMDYAAAAATSRSQHIRTKAKQYRLLFIQLGSVFDVLTADIARGIGGTRLSAAEFCTDVNETLEIEGILVLTEVEEFITGGTGGRPTLGTLRQRISKQLELTDVCLISSAPRIAFPRVPGSSIIEDAKVHCITLLEPSERAIEQQSAEFRFPALAFGHRDYSDIFRDALVELGLTVLAALDHAIFETMSGRNFVEKLSYSEIEALRGAGLVVIQDDIQVFAVSQLFPEFRDALASVLADVTTPPAEVGEIARALWTIERVLRRELRKSAMGKDQGDWKNRLGTESLLARTLQRANNDAYITAKNVSDLRDPIEWLTLEELLEIASSKEFNSLGLNDYVWHRLRMDLVPISNRLTHMRLSKSQDQTTANMWVDKIKHLLPFKPY